MCGTLCNLSRGPLSWLPAAAASRCAGVDATTPAIAMDTGRLATSPRLVRAGQVDLDPHGYRSTRATSSVISDGSVASAPCSAGRAERLAVPPLLVAASGMCLSRKSARRRRRVPAVGGGAGAGLPLGHAGSQGAAATASLAERTAAVIPVLRGAHAASPLAAWPRGGGVCRIMGEHEYKNYGATSSRIRFAAARAVAPAPATEGTHASRFGDQALLALSFLLSAAGNKILLRILLIFAAPYTHLLGVITNALYIATFSSQLAWARWTGARGLSSSLRFASAGTGFRCLAAAGICEAIAAVTMPLFASRLPGTLMPVMSQGILLFSMLFGIPLLGNRYSLQQIFGAAVVVAGVGICTFGGDLPASKVAGAATVWGNRSALVRHLLNVAGLFSAYAFFALAITVKERAFRRFRQGALDAGAEASQEPLRMEVVNLYTAMWQGFILLLLWPVNFALVTPLNFGEYFVAGAGALWQVRRLLGLYCCVNLFYTVATTAVLQRLSAIALLLTNVLNVPLVSLLFCLELPLLGAAPFHNFLLVGLAVIVLGLVTYNVSLSSKHLNR